LRSFDWRVQLFLVAVVSGIGVWLIEGPNVLSYMFLASALVGLLSILTRCGGPVAAGTRSKVVAPTTSGAHITKRCP
jgi:hypothetical protein